MTVLLVLAAWCAVSIAAAAAWSATAAAFKRSSPAEGAESSAAGWCQDGTAPPP